MKSARGGSYSATVTTFIPISSRSTAVFGIILSLLFVVLLFVVGLPIALLLIRTPSSARDSASAAHGEATSLFSGSSFPWIVQRMR